MRIGIVGAGPAGSTVARALARRGHRVTLFDPSHPREKPCGGGLGAGVFQHLPPKAREKLPRTAVRHAEIRSATGRGIAVGLAEPLYVTARRSLDAMLLKAALEAGARLEPEQVVGFQPGDRPTLRLASAEERTFDFVIGADGARSLIAREVRSPWKREDLTQTLGYFVPAPAGERLVVQFLPKGNGYLWAFPRPDHVSVGVGCDLGSWRSEDLWSELERFTRSLYGIMELGQLERFSALIPSPRERTLFRLQAEGPGWALCGDALGTVDPITREGIGAAVETGLLLSETIGSPGAYSRVLRRKLLPELRRAARWKADFFRPFFTELMVDYARRSEAIRSILSDLFCGSVRYRHLKARLLKDALPLAADYLIRRLVSRLALRAL